MPAIDTMIRADEAREGDTVRLNAHAKPTTVKSKTHLGKGIWEIVFATGEKRTYRSEEPLLRVIG